MADKKSDYFGDKKAIHDPDEYRRVGAFVIPEATRWENLRKAAQADGAAEGSPPAPPDL